VFCPYHKTSTVTQIITSAFQPRVHSSSIRFLLYFFVLLQCMLQFKDLFPVINFYSNVIRRSTFNFAAWFSILRWLQQYYPCRRLLFCKSLLHLKFFLQQHSFCTTTNKFLDTTLPLSHLFPRSATNLKISSFYGHSGKFFLLKNYKPEILLFSTMTKPLAPNSISDSTRSHPSQLWIFFRKLLRSKKITIVHQKVTSSSYSVRKDQLMFRSISMKQFFFLF
jgi:hypothetical protein